MNKTQIAVKKNIMILTYHMIPYASQFGSCQRMYFLAEQLFHQNFNVTVVASKSHFFGSFGKEQHFKAYYFGENEDQKNNTNQKNSLFKKNIKNFIKKIIEYPIKWYYNEPCNICAIQVSIWLRKYKKNILNVISEQKIETVIISGPPFILFSFVNEIKKNMPLVNVVFDFRDPWGLWNHQLGISFLREKKYLKLADKVVVVTEKAKEEKMKLFNIIDDKIYVVYNGYSSQTWDNVFKKQLKDTLINKKLKIAYIGSIDFQVNSYRDTTNFFKAYEEFRTFVDLSFIGVEENVLVDKLRILYPEVKFFPKVTHEESLRLMLENDVLLNIHTSEDTSGKYLIQGKIFDYVRSNKIIFSIGSLNDYTNVFINSKKFGLTTEDTVEGIKNIFSTLLNLRDSNQLDSYLDKDTNLIDISKYSREYQNNEYIKLLLSM